MNVSDFNFILKKHNLTIAIAESITAGLLTATITSVAGASSVLKGGIVTYQEELKIKLLGVNPETLKVYSAESMETTIEMVRGLANLGLNSDIYVAILFKNKLSTFETILKTDSQKDSRNQIREKTVEFVFDKIIHVVSKH